VRVLDRASDKVKEKVRPIEADIAKAFAAREYDKANNLLNRAFSVAK
jgi:hypothetical protein